MGGGGGCCRLTVRLAGWTVNWLQSGWLSIRSLGVQCTDLGSTLGGGVCKRGMRGERSAHHEGLN